MRKFFSDFKEFAMKGNVIDMAVGVVIGTAFSKIVSSLVADIITPLISLLLGKADFSSLSVVLREAVIDVDGTVIEEALTWNYGTFLQAIIDFLIIAFCIFVVIRLINNLKNGVKKTSKKLKHKKDEEPEVQAEPEAPKEPELTKEEILLTEIRDLLKERNNDAV